MQRLSVIVIFVLGMSAYAAPLSCHVTKALGSPRLVGNEEFWAEFGRLSSTGQLSDQSIGRLLSRYGVAPENMGALIATTASSTTALPRQAYSMTKKALKDVGRLPGHLRQKFDEFLGQIGSGVDGLKNLTNQPGRWGLEKLARGEFGESAYSVRLNGGYRVAFRTNKDGRYEIFDVTKSTTHKN